MDTMLQTPLQGRPVSVKIGTRSEVAIAQLQEEVPSRVRMDQPAHIISLHAYDGMVRIGVPIPEYGDGIAVVHVRAEDLVFLPVGEETQP